MGRPFWSAQLSGSPVLCNRWRGSPNNVFGIITWCGGVLHHVLRLILCGAGTNPSLVHVMYHTVGLYHRAGSRSQLLLGWSTFMLGPLDNSQGKVARFRAPSTGKHMCSRIWRIKAEHNFCMIHCVSISPQPPFSPNPLFLCECVCSLRHIARVFDPLQVDWASELNVFCWRTAVGNPVLKGLQIGS